MSAPRSVVARRTIPKAAALTALLAAAPLAPSAHAANFSQYPGFAQYFARHPPATTPADAASRELLDRHRPRLMVAPGQTRPIDFYRDYVARSRLVGPGGEVLADPADREALARHVSEPEVVLEYRPEPPRGLPAIYGRVDHARVARGGADAGTWTFLTYHAVFAHSGLPAGLTGWRAFALGAIGDLDDWHQLDHYTAVTLVLDAAGRPVAMVLQQHNYQHTYLFGEGAALPPDGRPVIDVALRSNELYPHRAERRVRRAVRFADERGMRYLITGTRRPLTSADDVTDGVEEVAYRLEFLPPSDPFYRFAGYLGERRLLPGRDGPPGADYNTRPALKPWPLQMLAGYWREGNAGDLGRWAQAVASGRGRRGFAERQAPVFFANLECLERRRRTCALR